MQIRYRKTAKLELLRTPESMQSAVVQWLEKLATEESHRISKTVNVIEFLRALLAILKDRANRTYVHGKWRRSDLLQRLQALLYVLERRQLPWSLHYSETMLTSGADYYARVGCYYELHKPNPHPMLVVTAFVGLPSRDSVK